MRMSERRLNNSIFLMYLVSTNYMKAHKITKGDFEKLDKKYEILNYIAECPDIFDSLTAEEMVEEIDNYVAS